MSVQPGDAFALKINSHRHQWNGQVCANPTHWKCGSTQNFRDDFCARGTTRCHQIGVFDPNSPKFLSSEPSLVSLLHEHPEFFNDQIVLFYGPNFSSSIGRSERGWEESLYGAYRVQRAEIVKFGPREVISIVPYPDGWAVFPRNMVRRPSIPPAVDGMSYLKRISGAVALESIAEADSASQELDGEEALSSVLQTRLEQFASSAGLWLWEANKRMGETGAASIGRNFATGTESLLGSKLSAAMECKRLDKRVIAIKEAPREEKPAGGETGKGSVEETVKAEDVTEPVKSWMRPALPEPACEEDLVKDYGKRLVTSIRIATVSKSLLLLAGATGVGKSRVANRLIFDPKRERTAIVPVASTWRGKEDLLGYVNPVNGEFEPTAMTRFLRRAELAWDAGDRRTWLVMFEEFNLSQPEHWLSDLLVLLEFEARADRTLRLGGTKIAGEEDGVAPGIYLPPSLMMVATLNNDHTVRPLSPRVLDRAGLVEVSASGREALQRAGVESTPALEEVVEDLNDVLRTRDAAFSVRTAKSLAQAIAAFGKEKAMFVLDHVLRQEVLSKVKLMSGDGQDEQLLEALTAWASRPACVELTLCRERIRGWADSLESGRDVFQA